MSKATKRRRPSYEGRSKYIHSLRDKGMKKSEARGMIDKKFPGTSGSKVFDRIWAALAVAVALVCSPLESKAGLQFDPVLNGGTNGVPANTTNRYANSSAPYHPFFFGKSTEVTFSLTFNCGANSTANYTITFDASVDNVNWQTNALVWQVAGNNTVSTNTYLTNLPFGQLEPFYRVGQIWNTNASSPAISNILVKAYSKDGV